MGRVDGSSTGGPTAGWARQLFAPRTGGDTAEIIAELRAHHPRAKTRPVQKAYRTAAYLHRDQKRKSGKPYITHPHAVALICAQLGLDTVTVTAALLHDTVEDTDYTLGQLRSEFGDEVGVLVDGVTKLNGSKWDKATAEAETYRKMIMASAVDLRVLIIKLADRLHNLRTLRFQPPAKQRTIARQSLDLLIPFAERLGLYVLKRELEDRAFAALEPDTYAVIASAVEAARPGMETYLAPVVERIRRTMRGHMRAEVAVHSRHLYAIHQDLQQQGVDLSGFEVPELRPHDLYRIIIVVDGTERDCYLALGAVHGLWPPTPGSLKDFIAVPKYNLYRSLHTTVSGPERRMMQVIIRTSDMHKVAEYGIAAGVGSPTGTVAPAAAGTTAGTAAARHWDLEWLQRLLAWQPSADTSVFLDSLRSDLGTGDVVTFTPTGESVSLPNGATPIDFAYALRTEVGDHAVGATINGRLAPLSSELKDGNVVEILTNIDAAPSASWLPSVATAQARLHIERWLADQRAEENSAAGRRLLAAQVGHDETLFTAEADGTAFASARRRGFRDLDRLYAAIMTEGVDVTELAAELVTELATNVHAGGDAPGTRELAVPPHGDPAHGNRAEKAPGENS